MIKIKKGAVRQDIRPPERAAEPLWRGFYAPYSFHDFPPCSLLLSILHPLLPSNDFSCSFWIFLCSLLLFFCSLVWSFAPCSFLKFPSAPFFFILGSIFFLLQSFLQDNHLLLYLFYGSLLAPLCQIGHAPCSRIKTPNRHEPRMLSFLD